MHLSGILRQMPLMAEIDKFAASGINDSQAHEYLVAKLTVLVPIAGKQHEQSKVRVA